MTTPASAPQSKPEGKWRTIALITLPILGILLVIVVINLVRPRKPGVVIDVVSGDQAGAAAINTGEIIDATVPGVLLEPRLGYRYKVFVDDESDDRSSGVAKIGGRVTFIPEARRGQTAIVDITRVRDRVVDAVLVRVLSEVDLPPKPLRAAYAPPAGDSSGNVVNGAEMDVVITEASAKNPTVDGIARVGGLVVVVNGVPTLGQRVNVRITSRLEKIAFAEPTGNPAGTAPLATSVAPVRRVFQPSPGDPVVAGAEMDVVITEASEKNPGMEGIARIGGLIVAVQGATTIGERVNIRITDRMERIAFAELTGNPAGTAPLASSGTTGDVLRRTFSPQVNDPAAQVIAGAEMDVVIAEASKVNPATEGVAKINGLIVFVQGATTIGERVNIRITARRERMAFAELSGKPAGAGPLPVETAPARPPRAAFIPGPGDSAAFVVPGAVIATTITEASSKNPATEGVAKVNGLVVFVRGATTIGQAVNVRIAERRERVAIGEVTTDAPTVLPAAPAPSAAPAAPALSPAPEAPLAAPEVAGEAPPAAEIPVAPETPAAP